MPIQLWQRHPERDTIAPDDSSRIDLYFAAQSSLDATEIIAAVEQALLADTPIPSEYQGLFQDTYDLEHQGVGLWHIIVHYAKQRPWVVDEELFQIDGVGSTVHIEKSLATQNSYGTNPPDFENLIGVNDENVAGCDIVTAAPTYTLSKKFDVGPLPPNFLDTITRMVGTINHDTIVFTWYGQTITCEAHELLLADVTARYGGKEAGVDLIEVIYKFSRQFNHTNITVGSITNIEKNGQSYLWVRWKQNQDANQRIKVPANVYIEQVYESTDFAELRLNL